MKKITDTDKKPILLRVSLLQPISVTTAIAPLRPPDEKIISERERLIAQVEHINQMAEELEAAILELKAIATTLNTQKRYPVLNQEP
jgi:DNA polymerase III delta prime subunit